MPHRALIVLLAVATLVSGCTGATSGRTEPVSDGITPTPSPSTPAVVEVDWDSTDPVDLGDGWTAAGCRKDGTPRLCIERHDKEVGQLLAESRPLSTLERVEDPLRELAEIEADGWGLSRSMCVSSAAFGVVPATVAGGEGFRYDVSVRNDGELVEHIIGFWTRGDRQYVGLRVDTTVPDACKAVADEAGFTPEELAAFGDRLDQVVAGSRLPDG